MSVNLTEVAVRVSKAEGLKDQVKIGNIREVLHVLFTQFSLVEIAQMWMKYNKVKM